MMWCADAESAILFDIRWAMLQKAYFLCKKSKILKYFVTFVFD